MKRAQVGWSSYAKTYDLMAANNPAYQQLVAQFLNETQKWKFNAQEVLLDLGAGTGNFSLELAKRFPHCQVLHIDADPVMNETAQMKANERCITNINITTQEMRNISFPPETISAIVCVHALYSFPNPQNIIVNMWDWLKPGSDAFVCDLGRILDIADWSKYLFRELYRQHGLLKTLSLFYQGRSIAKQNRLIAASQKSGSFWTHSLAEFCQTFESAGFEILVSYETYRGYSDLVVCQKHSP